MRRLPILAALLAVLLIIPDPVMAIGRPGGARAGGGGARAAEPEARRPRVPEPVPLGLRHGPAPAGRLRVVQLRVVQLRVVPRPAGRV